MLQVFYGAWNNLSFEDKALVVGIIAVILIIICDIARRTSKLLERYDDECGEED